MRYSENLQEKREREVRRETKRCACGRRTYEKNGVCVICKLDGLSGTADLRPAGRTTQ